MKQSIRKILCILMISIMILFSVASFNVSADSVKVNDNDYDGDGLTDTEENASDSKSDWDDPDTDGDGIIDSEDNEPDNDGKLEQYHGDQKGKHDAEDSMVNIFLFVLLLSFAVFSLLAGIFTAYFGAGKSRAIGGVLLALGLVVILFWVWFGLLNDYPDDSLFGVVHWEAAKTLEAVVTVIGAVVGATIAIVFFLVAIMKS